MCARPETPPGNFHTAISAPYPHFGGELSCPCSTICDNSHINTWFFPWWRFFMLIHISGFKMKPMTVYARFCVFDRFICPLSAFSPATGSERQPLVSRVKWSIILYHATLTSSASENKPDDPTMKTSTPVCAMTLKVFSLQEPSISVR